MKNTYILLMILALFAGSFTGCEDQEDTWADFTGDGRIRYAGLCENVAVKLGWEEAIVSWKNTLDPNRANILLEWSGGDHHGDTLLDKNAEICTLKHLDNAIYTFRVCAVDNKNRRSMAKEVYGRPFTMKHEILGGFTPVVLKWFPLEDDKLVLFFDQWQNTLSKAELKYYKKSTNELVSLNLTGKDSVLKQTYYLLEDISLEDSVWVNRTGQLLELPGVDIMFTPYILNVHQRIFNSDFVRALQTRYFIDELDENFINTTEKLELDYDMTSLEDLLYFPKLKEVQLGKNRYQYKEFVDKNAVPYSILVDTAASRFALQLLRDEKNVEVKRYNKHYFPYSFSGMDEMGNPVLPTNLNYITEADVTVTPLDQSGYDAHPELLVDNIQSTVWKPQQSKSFRQHEILIDLQEVKTVSGLKIAQNATSPIDSKYSDDHRFRPNLFKILVSKDLTVWESAAYDEDNTIGNTAGEITLLRMKDSKEVRYIKITVSDLAYYANFGVIIADIVPFNE